ncbi:MAG TPA: oxaloacetate decarboxylase subunit alpha [Cyanobacteria bacterium UBA8530]|nr:oxaloacetate decarboxylase subunit alpha [Cyanobacteria bacterium UBA8530]
MRITETVLRDAHQSLVATRMTTEEMLPVLEELDSIGYYSLEAWGGATFDSCLRFLDEDPWERLRILKKRIKNTKLQMLLRGQNLLGYKPYPPAVVESFIGRSISNGIDIIRIFDALNDLNNVEPAIRLTKREGGHAQASVSYTVSPVHTIEYFVSLAKQLEQMGADSLCIKDMAGLLTPYAAFDLVSALKKNISLPIQLHSHYSSGLASMTYLKAIEAGVDGVDTALSPLSLGTSQPPTESIIKTLEGSPYDTGISLTSLNGVAEHFRKLREKYLDSKLLEPKALEVDINALIYQIPGGMVSNLISQLRGQNALERWTEVCEEIPRVREDLGFPPLVTPTSQIVGTQAVLNVLMGERYKMITKETKSLVAGEYGRTPAPIKEDIRKKVLGEGEWKVVIQSNSNILEEAAQEIGPLMIQEEDVLSYLLFPDVARNFFLARQKKITQSRFIDIEKEEDYCLI